MKDTIELFDIVIRKYDLLKFVVIKNNINHDTFLCKTEDKNGKDVYDMLHLNEIIKNKN